MSFISNFAPYSIRVLTAIWSLSDRLEDEALSNLYSTTIINMVHHTFFCFPLSDMVKREPGTLSILLFFFISWIDRER